MTDWNKLKVVDLKAELKKRGLVQTGLKPALVTRLTEAENEGGTESEATVQGDAGINDGTPSSDTISPIEQTSVPTTEILPDAPLQTTSEPQIESSTQDVAPTEAPKETFITETQAESLPVQSTTVIELSQPPLQSQDSHQSALPSAEPQEILDDRQKRKRRSQSPAPSTSGSARKKARQDESSTAIVTSKEDATWVENHNAVDAADVNAYAMVVVTGEGAETSPTIVDVAKEEVQIQDVSKNDPDEKAVHAEDMEIDEGHRPKPSSGLDEDSPSRTRDSRFRDLFPAQQKASSLEKSSSGDNAVDAMDVDADRVVSPAVHPATSALYIRDFMRPLNPAQLKIYLTGLATPPGQDTDPDVVLNFYLDSIRTHAFVSLTSVSAAARIRSAIHDRIWPDERTRKPLWADFIPAEKVDEWVDEESSNKAGSRGSGKKWEVCYYPDDEGNVTATLQEATGFPPAQSLHRPSTAGRLSPQMPTKPRGIEGAPLGPRADTEIRASVTANSFSTLDQLFKATTTKPILYYKPVSKELADRRLDNINLATSKKADGRPVGGEINRYTFEDADVLVDRGPEIFPGIRPPRGYRGPGPAPRTGRGGGSYRGGGGYGGGSERGRYDSYRGGRRESRDDRRY